MNMIEAKEKVINIYCSDCTAKCDLTMKIKLEVIHFGSDKPCKRKKRKRVKKVLEGAV